MKRPYLPFFTRDWLDDIPLRSCSPAARGTLADLMCLAHEGIPYGFLAQNGSLLDPKYLAGRCNLKLKTFLKVISELEHHGRLKRDASGVLYVPRMVRDEEIRLKRAAGGVLGGNPDLSGKVNLPDNLQGKPQTSREPARTRFDSDTESSVLSGLGVQGEGGALPSDDAFRQLLGVFLASGVGASEADLARCGAEWRKLNFADRLAAVRYAENQAMGEWRERETKYIPRPWNYLRDRQWERSEPPRLLRKASAKDLAFERAVEGFIREAK